MSKINVTFRTALGNIVSTAVDAGTSLRQAFNSAFGKTYGAIDHQEITAAGAKVSKEKKLNADLEVAIVLKGEMVPAAATTASATTETTTTDSAPETITTTETSNANTATDQVATESTASTTASAGTEQTSQAPAETANAQPTEGVTAAAGIETAPANVVVVVETTAKVTFKGITMNRQTQDIVVERPVGTKLSEFMKDARVSQAVSGKRIFDEADSKLLAATTVIAANKTVTARAASSGG
jgi:hypothetical protein